MIDYSSLVPIIAFIASILSMTTSLISFKMFEDNNEYKESHKNRYNYIIFSLAGSVTLFIISAIGIGILIKNKV
jgi:hypothetical protein